MESTGEMSPLRTGCGGGGLFALRTLAPLPTGFLLGMTVGGLLTLVKEGSAGRAASMTLVAMLDGTEVAMVSLGGKAGRGCRAGRESFRTGRITWPSRGLSRAGGAGRAFEKRERPPEEGRTRDEVSISFVRRREPPFFSR